MSAGSRWRGGLAGAIAQLSWIKGTIAAFFRAQKRRNGARWRSRGGKGETLQGKRIVIVETSPTTAIGAEGGERCATPAGDRAVFTMVDRDEGATEAFAEAAFLPLTLQGREFLKD